MPTTHDLRQDRHLHDLDTETADLRKRIAANLRLINRVVKDANARLRALEPTSGQSVHPGEELPAKPSRRKPAPKRGTK